MDAVIKRDNELLSKLSTLDMTVKPTSELLTAGNKDVKLVRALCEVPGRC